MTTQPRSSEKAPDLAPLELRIYWTPGEDVVMEGDELFLDWLLIAVLDRCIEQVLIAREE